MSRSKSQKTQISLMNFVFLTMLGFICLFLFFFIAVANYLEDIGWAILISLVICLVFLKLFYMVIIENAETKRIEREILESKNNLVYEKR